MSYDNTAFTTNIETLLQLLKREVVEYENPEWEVVLQEVESGPFSDQNKDLENVYVWFADKDNKELYEIQIWTTDWIYHMPDLSWSPYTLEYIYRQPPENPQPLEKY